MASVARPADLAWGAFSDASAVGARPGRRMRVARPRCRRLRAAAERGGPRADHADDASRPGARVARVATRLSTALVPWLVRKRRAPLRRRPRPAGPTSPAGCASPPRTLGPTYIKLGQIISSRRGPLPRGAGRASSSSAATRCRPSRSTTVRAGRRGRPRRDRSRPSSPAFDRTPLAAASIAQVHAATPAHRRAGRGQGAAARRSPRSCARTCGSWRGWPRSSSAASRSPRWPTRRRWSSCSPRRSSRSSTSGSRPRTCSTSPRCSPSSASAATSSPAPTRRW